MQVHVQERRRERLRGKRQIWGSGEVGAIVPTATHKVTCKNLDRCSPGPVPKGILICPLTYPCVSKSKRKGFWVFEAEPTG